MVTPEAHDVLADFLRDSEAPAFAGPAAFCDDLTRRPRGFAATQPDETGRPRAVWLEGDTRVAWSVQDWFA